MDGLVLPSVRIAGGMHSARGFEWSLILGFSGGGRTLSVVFGASPPDRNTSLTPDLPLRRPSPPRSGTAPSSTSPTRPGSLPGDPTPPPPPLASRQRSCA